LKIKRIATKWEGADLEAHNKVWLLIHTLFNKFSLEKHTKHAYSAKDQYYNTNITVPEADLLKLCLDTLQLHPNDKWGGTRHVSAHLVSLQAACIEKYVMILIIPKQWHYWNFQVYRIKQMYYSGNIWSSNRITNLDMIIGK